MSGHSAENDLAIDHDDRKELADLWQQYAPLPAGSLDDGTYAALLAVARWGAGRMYDTCVTPSAEKGEADA